jgi:hypothetical protein
MGCKKLPYYHHYLNREKVYPGLKVVYKRDLGEEKRYRSKYQWDFIHKPESMVFVFLQDEEEGAIIDFNPVVELDKDKLPVSTGSATFFTPAGLPVYFSDMDKMSKMYFTTSAVNDCFDDEFKKGNCPEVANYIIADIGVLVAFKYDNKFYVPVFESAGNGISGTIKASDNIFRGYYSDGYYIDNYTPTNSTYKVYWYQNGWGEPLDFCFDYSSYLNAQYFNKGGYKGAGYYATYMERRTGHSCENYLAGLSDLDNLDFFNSTLSSKYNPWGYNGLLQKIEDREGEIRLVYSEINNGTKEYY